MSEATDNREEANPRLSRIVLLVLLIVAFLLRWRYMREISLFVDEFVTAWAARSIVSRGLPIYGVSIAYVDAQGRLRVGAIYLPVFDELYWATAGGGAFLNGRKISVSDTDTLERALVNISDFNTGPEDEREGYNRLKVEAIRRVHGRSMRTKNLSSAAVELAWVAAGRLDAYLMVFCHFWDAAAGTLLIREAGGRVSDLGGGPATADSTLVLTSNDALHDDLLEVFDRLGVCSE